MAKSLPRDLCKPEAIGMIRQHIGQREEELVANVCKIKTTADEILDKFRTISDTATVYPDAPVDVGEEIDFYNQKLSRIQNIANASKVR